MSQKPHPPLSARSLIAIAVLGMMALGGGIYFGVNYAVERAVVADAVDRAQHWTQYFLNAMPELDRLLADGELTAAQSEVIKTAQTVGNVYRFKLYNPTARQVLVSDDQAEADEDEDAEVARSQRYGRRRPRQPRAQHRAPRRRRSRPAAALRRGLCSDSRRRRHDAWRGRGLYRPDAHRGAAPHHLRYSRDWPRGDRGAGVRPADAGLPAAQPTGQRGEGSRRLPRPI